MSIRTVDKIEPKQVSELNPFERNSRFHTEKQIEQIKASITEWGFTIPILVDDENTVLAGHARLQAAQALGMDTVPCIVAAGWSDEQKRAYVIADNKLAENSEWDTGVYFTELKELSNMGFDISLTGLDAELSALSFSPNLEPVTGVKDVSDDSIQKAADGITEQLQSIQADKAQEGLEVMCPYCASTFRVSGV